MNVLLWIVNWSCVVDFGNEEHLNWDFGIKLCVHLNPVAMYIYKNSLSSLKKSTSFSREIVTSVIILTSCTWSLGPVWLAK